MTSLPHDWTACDVGGVTYALHLPCKTAFVVPQEHACAPPASDAPPATWQELAEATFPNSHAMSKEDRAAFDASAWPDLEPVEIESVPASDAPAPPRESSQINRMRGRP